MRRWDWTVTESVIGRFQNQPLWALRNQPAGTIDASRLHTSYALQTGYEQLIPAIGTITAPQIEQLRERFLLASDTCDVLAARDSLTQLLDFSLIDV